MQAQVDAAARAAGITLPTTLDPRLQAILDRLDDLSGTAFDRAWTKTQIIAHHKALRLNLAAAIRGATPELRTLALGALPLIVQHLAAAYDIVETFGDDGDHRDDDRGHDGKKKHRGDHDDRAHGGKRHHSHRR